MADDPAVTETGLLEEVDRLEWETGQAYFRDRDRRGQPARHPARRNHFAGDEQFFAVQARLARNEGSG